MANNILVVTSYPEKGKIHSNRTVGVASYTKQLLHGIAHERPQIAVVVWAEHFENEQAYVEAGIKVERKWKRNSFGSIVRLWLNLAKSEEKMLLISFEAYMFGGLFLGILFLWLFSQLKYFGKQTLVLMHQLPRDFLFRKGFSKSASRIGVHLLKMILNGIGSVVVFEETLLKRVGRNGIFIPHFVPKVVGTDQASARKRLLLSKDKQIILYFGYIAPYKGLEKLIQIWPNDAQMELVIAGGINPNHAKNPKMAQYVRHILALAKTKAIRVTGFVPEEEIDHYFSACDCVVLPYTELMSSSGPLAFAWAHSRATIMADSLAEYFLSHDISAAMRESGLKNRDIIYSPTQEDLVRVLYGLKINQDKFRVLAQQMTIVRSVEKVSRQFVGILTKEWS